MSTKLFCDIPNCGKEVSEYPLSNYVSFENIDFKVSIELAAISDVDFESMDICQECFWSIVNKMDAREIITPFRKKKRGSL